MGTSSSPTLLAIDTAGSACSVAVARSGSIVASERRPMRHGHGEALMPMVAAVTERAGIAPADFDMVAVSVGPGGFTGIRVGLAAARGISLVAGARLVGITSFAAVAASADPQDDPFLVGPLLVALDSRRAELYVQLYEAGIALAEPAAILPDQLFQYVIERVRDRPVRIAGDAVEPVAAALSGIEFRAIPDSAPDARGVIAATQRQLCSGRELQPAAPLYLRPPDVTLPKRAP